MPTVTVVRAKGILSGILNTVLEMTNILDGAFTEDNVLKLLHKKLGSKTRIAFYGEDIWEEAFGSYFTRHEAWSGLDL